MITCCTIVYCYMWCPMMWYNTLHNAWIYIGLYYTVSYLECMALVTSESRDSEGILLFYSRSPSLQNQWNITLRAYDWNDSWAWCLRESISLSGGPLRTHWKTIPRAYDLADFKAWELCASKLITNPCPEHIILMTCQLESSLGSLGILLWSPPQNSLETNT